MGFKTDNLNEIGSPFKIYNIPVWLQKMKELKFWHIGQISLPEKFKSIHKFKSDKKNGLHAFFLKCTRNPLI
jgi:hypothetical protein